MKLRLVPARHGYLWVYSGFQVFRAKPVNLVSLFMVYVLMCLMASTLPLIGPLALLVLMPSTTVGFMLASQRLLDGQSCDPAVFIKGLRHTPQVRRLLLHQGMIYAVLQAGAFKLMTWLGGDALERWLSALHTGDTDTFMQASSDLGPTLKLGLVLLVLISLLFWHAGALAYWHGTSTLKALFFSWMACWRNWKAYLVYNLAWVGLVIAAIVLMTLIAQVLGPNPAIAYLIVPLVLSIICSMYYASLLSTYRDCFDPADTAQPVLPEPSER